VLTTPLTNLSLHRLSAPLCTHRVCCPVCLVLLDAPAQPQVSSSRPCAVSSSSCSTRNKLAESRAGAGLWAM